MYSPLISSVDNIRAITGCLCQRVCNDTLVVGGGEVRTETGDEGPLPQSELRLVAAVTDTQAAGTNNKQSFRITSSLNSTRTYCLGEKSLLFQCYTFFVHI